MRLGIGLGLFKAGLISVGVRIFSAFQTRVIGDGGTVEAGACVVNGINGSALLQSSSLLLIPSGYKGGKLYSEIPTNGNGDLTWTRASTAIRTNSSGLLESMATGVPRLSYMYGSCPSVLLEPQRTNLDPNSQTFSGWFLTNSGGTTVTTVSASNPYNFSTVAKVIPDAVLGQHRPFTTINYSAAGRMWVIAKSAGYDYLSFGETGSVAGGSIIFNLSNGTISGSAAGYTGEISSLGGGWYKCSLNIIQTGALSRFIVVRNANSTADYTGDGTSGVLIAHKQMEVGAYDTTSILSSGATATRVADSSRTTGRSSLIGQSEGTLFLDLYYLPLQNQARAIAVTETSNPLTNRLIININNTNNRVSVISRQSNSLTNGSMSESAATVLLNGRNKIALGYKSGDSVLYMNGVQVATNTDSFTFSATLNDIFLMTSEINLVADNVGFVNSSALFTTRLTNAQLTTLTTL